MNFIIDIVLHAGRSAVEVAFYTLLPIMILMMIIIRALEVSGALDRIVAFLTPLVRPFGLNGLGVLAMIQISFVSFVAPITTLALMDARGMSDRRIAAAFAAILSMAPANALFPLAALGLHTGITLGLSAIGGLLAATTTYWFVGRRLSNDAGDIHKFELEISQRPTVLNIINVSGHDAIRIVVNIIPMLMVSLFIVFMLQSSGTIDALVRLLSPMLVYFGIDSALVLPAVTKYLAGSTALVGVVQEVSAQAAIAASSINASAGFLLHPLDLPGIAIFLSSINRLSKVWAPAIVGAFAGITFRTVVTVLMT